MRSVKVMLSSLALVVLMGFFVPALAQSGSGDDPPAVDPNVLSENEGRGNGNGNGNDVLGTSEGVLPFTGSELALFVVIGLVAVGAGVMAVRVARARNTDPTGNLQV